MLHSLFLWKTMRKLWTSRTGRGFWQTEACSVDAAPDKGISLPSTMWCTYIRGTLLTGDFFWSQPFTPDCHALDTFIESLDYITEFEVGYNASTETFEGHTLDTVAAKWFLRLATAPRWDSSFDGFHSCCDSEVSILEWSSLFWNYLISGQQYESSPHGDGDNGEGSGKDQESSLHSCPLVPPWHLRGGEGLLF